VIARLARTAIVGAAAVVLTALLMPATWRMLRGATLVARAAAPHGVVRALANLDTVAVEERLLVVPVGGAPMRARA
jgi:hypothetical protein